MYNCLRSDYGIKQEELILYGQSVGSGPTLHMASRLKRLRGVVLHSAILSGIRVLYPVKMTLWFDIFKVSLKHTKDVSCWSLYILYTLVRSHDLIYIAEHRQDSPCQLQSSCHTCMYSLLINCRFCLHFIMLIRAD